MGEANFIRRQLVLYFLIVAGLLVVFPAISFASDAVCARAKIEVKQELTLERQAFDAHMRISNGLTDIALENIRVDVAFVDEDGNPVLASYDPDRTDALFFLRLGSMENIEDVGGIGTVDPATTADIHWLIIPSPGASQGVAKGTLYYVGAKLTYTIGGEEKVTEVTPDYIFVKPMPEITLDYFLPTDVLGDDAFTSEIEPPIPFSLGVRISNSGFGVARNLKIDSAQPKIVENGQGLLVGFTIEGSEVNGKAATPSLLVDMGDLSPANAAVARWIMTCTLSGRLVKFDASFSHSDELGGELTSLIAESRTHFLVHDVLVDLPGRDSIRDFLARDADVYRVYESDAVDTPVTNQSGAATLQMTGNTGTLQTPATSGCMYLRLNDPFDGRKVLKKVIRSDGKIVKAENVWLSKTRDENLNWQYSLNLFDVNTTNAYTIEFLDDSAVPLPPVLAFIANRTGIEGQRLAFMVEANDPNGTIPVLAAAPLPAGANFTDQGAGTGIFDWTPNVGQAGGYEMTFKASDGVLEDRRRVGLSINSLDDTDGDGLRDAWEMEHFRTLDRDGSGDFDEDGLTDLEEYLLGSDPTAEDHAPSTPAILSPMNGAEVDVLAPDLVIANSIDSDGDRLSYEFELFADPGLTQWIGGASNAAEGSETTTWHIPEPLPDNHHCYWRARATDGYSCSLWAYGTFFINSENETPGGFNLSYPLDDTEVTTPTPILEVTNSVDADEDSVAYTFEVYADSDMHNLVASSSDLAAGANGRTSWTVASTLEDYTWYYWKAIATDAHQAQRETLSASFLVNLLNHAPGAPALLSPAAGNEVVERNLDLVVGNAQDLDGDVLAYRFELDTAATFDSPNKRLSEEIAEGVETTAWHVAGLSDNTRYFWRIKAGDGVADSRWAAGDFFVNTANDVPAVPTLRNPGENAWVETLTPSLSVNPAFDPDDDGVIYRFEVYADDALTTLVDGGESSVPERKVACELVDKTRYFWRARAEDEHGSASDWMNTSSFFVQDAGV
ncbi:MAG: hypothetical protein JSW39_22180, partial [Desulfobacterales bacterium]